MSLTIIVVLVVAPLDLSRADGIKMLIHGPEESQQPFKSGQKLHHTVIKLL